MLFSQPSDYLNILHSFEVFVPCPFGSAFQFARIRARRTRVGRRCNATVVCAIVQFTARFHASGQWRPRSDSAAHAGTDSDANDGCRRRRARLWFVCNTFGCPRVVDTIRSQHACVQCHARVPLVGLFIGRTRTRIIIILVVVVVVFHGRRGFAGLFDGTDCGDGFQQSERGAVSADACVVDLSSAAAAAAAAVSVSGQCTPVWRHWRTNARSAATAAAAAVWSVCAGAIVVWRIYGPRAVAACRQLPAPWPV